MWKTATAVLGALLVVTNAWWIYAAIDRAVTQSYQDQVLYEQNNRVLALSALADQLVKGMGRDEAMALLQKSQLTETPYEKDGASTRLGYRFYWKKARWRACCGVPRMTMRFHRQQASRRGLSARSSLGDLPAT